MRTSVIIPAAGVGRRFGSEIPKQFLPLGGVPIIVRTLQVFEQADAVEHVILALAHDYKTLMLELAEEYNLSKIAALVDGGAERQDSIHNALQTPYIEASDIVLVHDAVRPFITPEFTGRIIHATATHHAVVPGTPPKETVKEVKEMNGASLVHKTHDRARLRLIQTPQGFQREMLVAAYRYAAESGFQGTDDASVVEYAGKNVVVAEGLEENIKITTPMDFAFAEYWLHQQIRQRGN